jgi:hypothetical protein
VKAAITILRRKATRSRRLVLTACVALPLMATSAEARGMVDGAVIANRLSGLKGGPSAPALHAALAAFAEAANQGTVARPDLLTVIDYTRPSTEPRLWVLDLQRGSVLYHELVAHGKRSGENVTRAFSNAEGSLMTSLGLFVTDTSYVGSNGYSLRLRGLEAGINDNAFARAIVIHGATYVSQAIADKLGRLGRSWGCPAVRSEIARKLIDTIKGGTAIYAYGGPAADAAARQAAH